MKPQLHCPRSRGFALVVTLSLMVLLTIIAVGLLTLSSISLRASSQGQAMAEARANARLAMMMALGQLQKTAGPDRRVTAPANLAKATHPEGLAGVWKSWKPAPSGVADQDYVEAKKGGGFLGYLMSNPDPAATLDPQMLPAPSSLGSTPLVSTGSLGNNLTNREISAPLVPFKSGTASTAGNSGSFAWTVLDEGVKSRIDLLPADEPAGVGDLITQAGTPARNRFIKVDGMGFLDEPAAGLHDSLPKLITLNEAQLKASSRESVQRLFNDFTVNSSSLQVDVANGGLKTDLSVLFDGQYGATLPAGYAGRFLYSDNTTPFQNATSDSQWELYANYARLYRRTTAADNPKDGLKATLPVATTPPSYLKTIEDATLRKPRYEPDMSKVKRPVLMPTVARVDMVFSLVARDNHTDTKGGKYMHLLHLMYLPVITLHNPYNINISFHRMNVTFHDMPIAFNFMLDKDGNGNFVSQSIERGTFESINIMAGNGPNKFAINIADWKDDEKLASSSAITRPIVMKPGQTLVCGPRFRPNRGWADDQGNDTDSFDWNNDLKLTESIKARPGVIPGLGFETYGVAPACYYIPSRRVPAWSTLYLHDNATNPAQPTSRFYVNFKAQQPRWKSDGGPTPPNVGADPSFVVTADIQANATATPTTYAKLRFHYKDDATLKKIGSW